MKFGLYLPNFGPYGDPRHLADLAVLAEEAGWDGFFLWDHLTRYWPTDVADVWVAMGAIAARTKRIRFGALVTPLARRRPWQVAREAVTLDRLSNGRLILGVGLGSSGGAEVEWENFGEEMDLKQRAGMLDESLAIITGLWSGETFSFSGEHYRVKDSQFLPKPVQQPRIPVWIAGNWPHKAPFRRMARWDGMLPQTNPALDDDLPELAQAIQFTLAQRENQQPFDVAYSLSPDQAKQPERYAAIGVNWLVVQLYPTHFGADWKSDWPLAAMQAYLQAGPPKG
ncbi:MAG: hypothetical protein PWQ55_2824 [Chloroflexota bacterium]|nr:hypothetical protein [Chloroflexota bacterium]